MITLTNNYHDTTVRLHANIGDTLTVNQVKRARRVLCGLSGCSCGGNLGERGKQAVEIVPVYHRDYPGEVAFRLDSGAGTN